MNSLKLRFPNDMPAKILPTASDTRPVMEYKDGKRSETPKCDSEGRPLHSFEAALDHPLLEHPISGVRVISHLKEIPKVGFGEPLDLVDAVLTARGTKEEYEMAGTVEVMDIVRPSGGAPLPRPKND